MSVWHINYPPADIENTFVLVYREMSCAPTNGFKGYHHPANKRLLLCKMSMLIHPSWFRIFMQKYYGTFSHKSMEIKIEMQLSFIFID